MATNLIESVKDGIVGTIKGTESVAAGVHDDDRRTAASDQHGGGRARAGDAGRAHVDDRCRRRGGLDRAAGRAGLPRVQPASPEGAELLPDHGALGRDYSRAAREKSVGARPRRESSATDDLLPTRDVRFRMMARFSARMCCGGSARGTPATPSRCILAGSTGGTVGAGGPGRHGLSSRRRPRRGAIPCGWRSIASMSAMWHGTTNWTSSTRTTGTRAPATSTLANLGGSAWAANHEKTIGSRAGSGTEALVRGQQRMAAPGGRAHELSNRDGRGSRKRTVCSSVAALRLL